MCGAEAGAATLTAGKKQFRLWQLSVRCRGRGSDSDGGEEIVAAVAMKCHRSVAIGLITLVA